MKIRIFIFSLVVILINNIASAQAIQSIKIIGNYRVEPATVKSFLSLHEGDIYSDSKVDDSLKSLYASNLFSNINISMESSTLKIKVAENPKINKIIFEGNNKVKDEILTKEISLSPRSVYTKHKLQNDVNRLIDIYSAQGKYSAKVVPKIVELEQNRVDLIFEIDEGIDSKISKILFVGNKHFQNNKLKQIINSKESVWYSFLSSNDKYNPNKIDYDKELLSRFYRVNGYARFQIISTIADISSKKDNFYITFTLEEGNKYKIGEVSINSNFKKIDTNVLKQFVSTKSGNIYNIEDIEKTEDKITKYLNDQGFAFVSVDPIEKFDDKNKIINIEYQIYEGRKAYLRSINIKGNLRTSEKIIRREFNIQEGDPFNSSRIIRSERNINELDFFDDVIMVQKPTSDPDKFDINVEVKEKSTASLSFAGGYNTSEGPLGMITLTENNFLGNGQEVSLNLKKASKKVDFDISYTEPYFMDMPLSVGVDLYKSSESKDKKHMRSYTQKSKGFSLRSGYEIVDNLSHGVRYSFSHSNISDMDSKSSQFLKDQEGKKIISSVGHRLVYDKRNSKVSPSSGYFGFIDQQFAGIGGNVKYLRNEIAAAYYTPVYGDDVVFELSGKIGHIKGLGGQKTRLNDRFFLGGDSLRGFEFSGLGARAKVIKEQCDLKANEQTAPTQECSDDSTKYKELGTAGALDGEALGGKTFYNLSAEIKFPISDSKELGVYGTVFAEAGEVINPDMPKNQKAKYFYDRGIRSSVGVSVGFNTPMGPIKLNYSRPITKGKYDKIEKFYISFSTTKF